MAVANAGSLDVKRKRAEPKVVCGLVDASLTDMVSDTPLSGQAEVKDSGYVGKPSVEYN